MKILQEGRDSHFDPEILDAFAAIARDLYGRYAGHDSDDLKKDLAAVVEKYFSAGIETLSYSKV